MLTAAQREQLQRLLPAESGYDLDAVRVFECAAQLTDASALDEQESAVVAGLKEKVAGPALMTDGKPTILRVVAWMAHGDAPNRNRDAFVKEELAAVAPSLFRAPNFGVMDFNHSAVRPWSEDPKVIGVWYRAEYAFDQHAEQWGILATGMMFAWAYPEFATTLLGEQARSGSVSFSMACIPGGVEYRQDEAGTYAVLHNPVFFTLSALDVPPADPAAQGAVTEDPAVNEDDLRARVASAAEEAGMTEELIQQLTSERDAALAQIETLNAGAATDKQTLEARVTELETRIAELETVRDAAVAERDAAIAERDALAARVAELDTKVSAFEAENAERNRAALLQARLSSLPEAVRAMHAKKDEETRKRVEAKWAAMADAEWEQYKTDELLGYVPPTKVGFVLRSANEGALPAAGGDSDDIKGRILRQIKR